MSLQAAHRRREVGKARAQVRVAGRARVDAALAVDGVDEDGALFNRRIERLVRYFFFEAKKIE